MQREPFEQQVRRLAVQSIGRGCFFAALAIWCVMIGLIAEPQQALRAGGLLCLLVCCVLLLKAQGALARSFKHTEVWILMDRKLVVTPDVAQRVFGAVLREIYLRCALYAGSFGVAFILLGFLAGRLLR